jgi:cathepsin D
VVVGRTTSGFLRGRLSGILGLGFERIAQTGYKPWWKVLSDQGVWSAPEMSFYMKREQGNPSATDYEDGGVVTLGGRNPSYYSGQIEFTNVIGSAWWLVPVAGITVQGRAANVASGGLAAIDTGTSLIGGPTSDVASIWSQVPGSAPATSANLEGFYTFRVYCVRFVICLLLGLTHSCQPVIQTLLSPFLLEAKTGPSQRST